MRGLSVGWSVRTLVAAVLIPPLLRVVSLGRLAAWLGRSPSRPARPAADDAVLAARVDRLLTRLPWLWRRTCLRRSTVLYYLLRRAGRPVELCVGVRRAAGEALGAHAWLVLGNEPYLEPAPGQPAAHQVIARFPEPKPRQA